ncbi:MAG: arsenate-mycothiol transferase ArsC [Planktomarina sp.]
MTDMPTSVLFCCDQNTVRSPMAEGILKKHVGTQIYVQSAGVKSDMDIDGFAIAVCAEIGVELSRHQARSFDDMREDGNDLSSFDLIIALTPTSHTMAQEMTKSYATAIEFWPIMDPSGKGDMRDEKLDHYRAARDQIADHITKRFAKTQ